MTCIVGIKCDGFVYMGADSMASDTYSRRVTNVQKVFKVGDFLIGYTTSFRMGQLLQFAPLPSVSASADLYKYMVTEFVPRVRDIFKESGFSKIENNEESAGNFLVGIMDRLFCVESDYQVQEYLEPIAAIGSGEQYALGAMSAYMSSFPNANPLNTLLTGLSIAAKYSVHVTEPFYCLSTFK